jgi:quercetin dioxygenase-like cupin family protein
MQASHTNTIRVGDFELRFLVDETQGSGNLVIFEFAVPPGARVPAPHYHREVDEAVYGLEGTLTTVVDGQAHEVGIGDTVLIPRGKVHHHRNESQRIARVLTILTPGSIGRRYFEELALVANGPGKPDLAKIKEIMLRHGLVPAQG